MEGFLAARTLDDFVKNVPKTDLNQSLIFIADPRKEHYEGGIFPDSDVGMAQDAIREKFEEGAHVLNSLLKRLVRGLSNPADFHQAEFLTRYDYLEALMSSRPSAFIDKTRAVYRRFQKDAAARRTFERRRGRLTPETATLAELSHYTHLWRQHVEKPSRQGNPYEYLRSDHYDFARSGLFVRANPNNRYPNYRVHSYSSKIKNVNRLIEKFMVELMTPMLIRQDAPDHPINTPDIKDYFGARLIATNWTYKNTMDDILGSAHEWEVIEFKKKKDDPRYGNKNLKPFVYYISRIDNPSIVVCVHFLPLPDLLLGEFFDKDRHDLYVIERQAHVDRFRRDRVLGQEYRRMEYNLSKVLSFLHAESFNTSK